MSRQRKRFSLEEIDERRKQLDRLALCDSREQPADWYGDVADMLLQLLLPVLEANVRELEARMVERTVLEQLELVPVRVEVPPEDEARKRALQQFELHVEPTVKASRPKRPRPEDVPFDASDVERPDKE